MAAPCGVCVATGASTITQQVAKNLFQWPGRSALRKAIEAWITIWIELAWPKRRILEVYVNVAQLGPCVFGAEAASWRYFGRPASRTRTVLEPVGSPLGPSTPHAINAPNGVFWLGGNVRPTPLATTIGILLVVLLNPACAWVSLSSGGEKVRVLEPAEAASCRKLPKDRKRHCPDDRPDPDLRPDRQDRSRRASIPRAERGRRAGWGCRRPPWPGGGRTAVLRRLPV